MRADETVSRRKFERELSLVLENRRSWENRGCFILRNEFPNIDAIFVPKIPLHVTAPGIVLDPNGQMQAQQILVQKGDVTGRAFGVRVNMADYDLVAPSVKFVDPFTWAPSHYGVLPKAQFIPAGGGAPSPILLQDLTTREPFLCVRGVREFYDHPQHSNENWFIERSGFGLHYVLDTVCRTCCEQAAPCIQLVNTGTDWLAIQGVNNGPA